MSASERMNLANHFLIAMPGMEDGVFSRSVIYVCEHSENGALGLIVNKPGGISMLDLFERVELPLSRKDLGIQPVFHGGPVQTGRGFVLHDPIIVEGLPKDESIYASTLTVPGGLEMTTSRDVLEALSHGGGPRRAIVMLGYSAWAGGQLESEIAANAWLTAQADPSVIFDAPIDERYERALELLGLTAWTLSPHAGHA